jgi:1,4-dihydroxy-2-naphthoate octaprenyltransferase
VFLGAAVAWFTFGAFNLTYFILSLIGAICINAGTNLANDYFDYKSGCDLINTEFNSPFSGGSGLLPKGIINPKKVYIASLISFILAGFIGVFFALTVGWVIVVIGLLGVFSGYFYTTQLATRGVGELIVGLNCGPLVAIGSYYVQTQTITWELIMASIPIGILILAVLWINEIPDYYADTNAGKKTLVTRIGRKKAADAYSVLMFSTYVVILVGVLLSLMPVLTLLSFLTAPLAAKVVYVARKNYETPKKLIPANAGTVLIHLFTGLLLCIAYVISGYLAML